MIVRKQFLSVLMISLVLAAASAGDNSLPQTGNTGQIILDIIPGSSYTNRGWFFIFPFKKGPQTAAWIEDEKGSYIRTIVVSDKTAMQKWIGAPEAGRPDSLPWFMQLI